MTDVGTLPAQPTRTPLQAYIIMAVGVLGISMGSIFIRLAQDEGVPSLMIAAGRLCIAALILTPFTLRSHYSEIRRLSRNDLLLAAAAGLFLALHFAAWVQSLEFTTVLISVVLVNTHPLWVGLLEVFFLKARLSRHVIMGLIIGLAGSLIVVFPQDSAFSAGRNPLLGSALALIGAVTVAVYFTIGRKLRGGLSVLPYIWLVYSCAAVILLAVVLLGGIPVTGYSHNAYLLLAAMAVIPQLMGHSSFNYVLKFFPATYVSIATQLEPAASALVAFFLFREIPNALQVLGSVTILMGIVLATIGQNSNAAKQAA